jgi:hypothetical protein
MKSVTVILTYSVSQITSSDVVFHSELLFSTAEGFTHLSFPALISHLFLNSTSYEGPRYLIFSVMFYST